MARTPVETPEYLEMLKRLIRRAGERVGDADEFELYELSTLVQDAEAALRVAIKAQRARGRSWAYIGDALGMDRSWAYTKYGKDA